MEKKLWTYSGQLYTHSNSNILSVLDEIAISNYCMVTYENIERNQQKGISINYKYTGEKENIELVQNDINNLKFNIAQQHLNHYFSKYSVNSVEQEISKNKFNMTVNVSKFSNFMEIAKAVALELDIPTSVHEKNLGFLKGKDVNIQVVGEPIQLNKYKLLINNFIEDTPKKKLKR